jgi:HEAT repeat protein
MNVLNQTDPEIDVAITKFKSLHDGNLGFLEVIALGRRAAPALREVLFQRDPSGLFEVRCRAVYALAALGSRDTLLEFLRLPHDATDPVERLGNDAVINAAARAVAKHREEHVFQLFLTLAKHRILPGVIAALGSFQRPQAIPFLIDALAEDECRPAAEAALAKLGQSARPALKQITALSSKTESVSRLRQRQSAQSLLAAMSESKGQKLDRNALTG